VAAIVDYSINTRPAPVFAIQEHHSHQPQGFMLHMDLGLQAHPQAGQGALDGSKITLPGTLQQVQGHGQQLQSTMSVSLPPPQQQQQQQQQQAMLGHTSFGNIQPYQVTLGMLTSNALC